MALESRRRAMPMSSREMVFMVKILDEKDYDCKLAKYPKPNIRKNHILQMVVAVLQRKCGVTRTKYQIRKRWSDLKNKESTQLENIRRLIVRKRIRKNFRKMHNKQEPGASVESNKSQQSEEEKPLHKLGQEVSQIPSTNNIALQKIASCMEEIRRLKASICSLEKDISEIQQLISNHH